jgi:hypothetical protein
VTSIPSIGRLYAPRLGRADRLSSNAVTATLERTHLEPSESTAAANQAGKPVGSIWWFRGLLALATIAIAISWVIVHTSGLIGLNGDEAAHLLHARRVVDSVSPGFGQIGQYWPPLFQVAELPFAWIDPLYRSGWAGTIPAGLFYLASVAGAYRLGVELTGDRRAGAIAGFALGANPNMLYLGSIPMMETSIVASIVWAAASLVRATRTLEFKDVIFGGMFAGLASFATYGAWALVLYGPACIALAARRHNLDWQRVRFLGVSYAAMAAYPCLLWLLWCFFIQNDATYFLHVASLGGVHTLPAALAGRPHNLLFALANYGFAVMDIFGPVPTVLALGLLALAVVRRRFLSPVGAGLAAAGVAIAAMISGGAIGSPTYAAVTHLRDPLASYLNVRYGLWMGPFIAAAAAIVAGSSRRRQIVVGSALAVSLLWFGLPAMRAVAVPPKSQRGVVVTNASLGKIFKSLYKSGEVLTFSPGSGDTIIWRSGLPASDFITQFNPKQFAPAFAHPAGHVRYVFIEPDAPLNLDPLKARLPIEGFRLIYNHHGYQVWEAQ